MPASGDVFSGPFNGHICRGWSGETSVLQDLKRHFEYREGRRVLRAVSLETTDTTGGQWNLQFDIAAPPWIPNTLGYTPGSWKDGGTFHTYHGPRSS